MVLSYREAAERLKKLRVEIRRYREAYHIRNESLVSDAALDSLKKELFDLEQQYPDLVTPDSPTQRVAGKPLREFRKVRHGRPMLSFNDAFSETDMRAWFDRVGNYLGRQIDPDFYCELKIDGLAIELVYENGALAEGSTRGDGQIGEDVTQNLKTVEAIPLRLTPSPHKRHIPKRLVVRGEVFLARGEFARINREQERRGLKPYANPRNVAAGSVRQLDPGVTAARRLDSFVYDIVSDLGLKTHEEKHDFLHALGFKTNPHNRRIRGLDGVFAFRDYWEGRRDRLEYEIDGVVAAVNDAAVFDAAGTVGKAPRAAIAYKFSPREATTRVRSIVVQVGRTGTLTPVATVDPVFVGGVTITHATLHNADEIRRLGLRIGDTIVVSRAGDVIPKITAVLPKLRTGKERAFLMPKRCPVDGSPVVIDGALLRCSNARCGARQRETLYHFVSRAAFDVLGLGPKIIDRFSNDGLIADAADIFSLRTGDIAALPRFGEKSAENIVREIDGKRRITLPRFLYALSVLHMGEETARLIAREVHGQKPEVRGPKDLLRAMQGFSLGDFMKIEGVGPKVAASVYGWFREKRNAALLEKLERSGVRFTGHGARAGHHGELTGKTFVFTGSLEHMTRDEAKELVRGLGGRVSESVSKETGYVVAGSEPGSKYERAKKLGVRVLDEAEFRRLVA